MKSQKPDSSKAWKLHSFPRTLSILYSKQISIHSYPSASWTDCISRKLRVEINHFADFPLERMHQIISSSWTTVENTAKPFIQTELGAPCCQQVLLRWGGHQVKSNRVFTSVVGLCWLCSSYLRTLPTCLTGCQRSALQHRPTSIPHANCCNRQQKLQLLLSKLEFTARKPIRGCSSLYTGASQVT